jgi:hypothetical protein
LGAGTRILTGIYIGSIKSLGNGMTQNALTLVLDDGTPIHSMQIMTSRTLSRLLDIQ